MQAIRSAFSRIRHYLDPAERLSEILFGVVMAMGFTGAVRIGLEEASSRELLIGILGCNIAWGVVDGVMYVLGCILERGCKARVLREAIESPNEEVALARLSRELDGRLGPFTTQPERTSIYRRIIESARLERTHEQVGG